VLSVSPRVNKFVATSHHRDTENTKGAQSNQHTVDKVDQAKTEIIQAQVLIQSEARLRVAQAALRSALAQYDESKAVVDQRLLNWVHLASRYPVRFRVQDLPPHLFRGQSAVLIIRNH